MCVCVVCMCVCVCGYAGGCVNECVNCMLSLQSYHTLMNHVWEVGYVRECLCVCQLELEQV